MASNIGKELLWGNSVSLAWTWGYGTYLSIQIALSYGMIALLVFCIPNAIGLALFGVLNNSLSKRLQHEHVDYTQYCAQRLRKYALWLMLFQLLALTINVFGFIRYVCIPLGLPIGVAALTLFIIPIICIGFGTTAKIKWIHLPLGIFIYLAILYLLANWHPELIQQPIQSITQGLVQVPPGYLLGWSFMMTLSFVFAPWLDIQHWQRAVQIQQEQVHLGRAYIWGGILFFLIVFFHGCLALYLKQLGTHFTPELIMGNQYSFRQNVMSTLNQSGMGFVYIGFLFLIAIGSITSSLASYRWYFKEIAHPRFPYMTPLYYIAGFIIAIGFALAGLQVEVLQALLAIVFIYTFSIAWMMLDPNTHYYQHFQTRKHIILALAFWISMLLTQIHINVLSGIWLLLIPTLSLAGLFWLIKSS